jgi:hypothetical protein
MAKPTGINGPLKIGVDADGMGAIEFEQVNFPSEKSDIERMVASAFVRCIGQMAGPGGETLQITDLVQNPEDDFDFTVTMPDGPAYLELMEAAPLHGPYKKAPAHYKPYDYASQVLAQIGEKAANYPSAGVRKIYLLVYITHWAFILSESTVNCLRHWLASLPSPFAGVFLYMPITATEGISQWLLPAPLPAGFHPNQVINKVVTNGDPRAAEPVEGGGAVLIKASGA